MSDSSERGDLWAEAQKMMAEMSADADKNLLKCNVASGVRLRKKLRALRKVLSTLVAATVDYDKHITTVRKEKAKAAAKSSV